MSVYWPLIIVLILLVFFYRGLKMDKMIEAFTP
jgi:hypothetical protein